MFVKKELIVLDNLLKQKLTWDTLFKIKERVSYLNSYFSESENFQIFENFVNLYTIAYGYNQAEHLRDKLLYDTKELIYQIKKIDEHLTYMQLLELKNTLEGFPKNKQKTQTFNKTLIFPRTFYYNDFSQNFSDKLNNAVKFMEKIENIDTKELILRCVRPRKGKHIHFFFKNNVLYIAKFLDNNIFEAKTWDLRDMKLYSSKSILNAKDEFYKNSEWYKCIGKEYPEWKL